MALGFEIGDITDIVDVVEDTVRGTITRIEYKIIDEVETPWLVEYKNEHGIHYETFDIDSSEFSFITKVN